jgi:hypothetical protein
MWAIPRIPTMPIRGPEGCELRWVVSKPTRIAFIMNQFRVGTIDTTIAAIDQPIAVVDIVVRHRIVGFVEAA